MLKEPHSPSCSPVRYRQVSVILLKAHATHTQWNSKTYRRQTSGLSLRIVCRFALYLATKWRCTELRKRIIGELSLMMKKRPANNQINLARKCSVAQWLLDAYTLVIDTTLSDLIGLASKEIGGLIIAKLFFVRE
ncbi:hypothetical protein BDN70DRAFT_79656 [Pholiota conissans]|uniref:Uncharacterized protein n=1 Tax=Pholiota conissans TaxID=109636 RepID=A0A9P5Z0G6_9AGAR|nr:hypothetical protein BDN70DRAFT_79656 [Pholiota conissans]